MLVSLARNKLSLREIHRFQNFPVRTNQYLHWDLPRLWHEVKHGLNKVAEENLPIASLGVDTWGVDFGLLGKEDMLLADPIHYLDSHTEAALPRLLRRLDPVRIYQTTGIQIMRYNTLVQLEAMRAARSPQLASASTLLMMGDLFHFLLSGEKCCEYTNATTTQILHAGSTSWAVELLTELGIDPTILPPVVLPGTRLGPLREKIRQECNLTRSIPIVAPATHDTASAVAAVPALEGEDWCYLSSGTWSLMGVELASPLITSSSLATNYTNEGGVGDKIRFLKNLAGLWLLQECRRWWASQGRLYSYDELVAMATRAKSLTFLVNPDEAELMLPGNMPERLATLCHQSNQVFPDGEGGDCARLPRVFGTLLSSHGRNTGAVDRENH